MKMRILLALAALTLAPLMPSCTYSQMVHRQEDGMAKLNRALTAVQDKKSADAAAPVVRQYGSLLRSDIDKLISNGKPSLIQLALLKKSYQNSELKAESKSALREFFRIYGQSYYGSTELRQAFIDMLKAGATTTPQTTTSSSALQQQINHQIKTAFPSLMRTQQ